MENEREAHEEGNCIVADGARECLEKWREKVHAANEQEGLAKAVGESALPACRRQECPVQRKAPSGEFNHKVRA